MIERCAIIALANLVFFSKSLCYQYSSDDIPASQRPKHPSRLWHWFGVLEGRARHTPQADHALTMLIHASVCVFLYLGFGASDISFLAALLFAFNPANNQVSVWIAGRGYALPALGMTMTMALPWLAPVLLLGVSYYNIGYIAPLVFIGSPVPYVVLFMPLAWMFHMKRFKMNVGDKISKEMYSEDKSIKPEKFVLFTKTVGFYFTQAIIPVKTTFYHSFLQSAAGVGKTKAYSMRCRFFWIGVVVLSFFLSYLLLHPWNLSNFALLWWFFCLAPFCNFIRVQQEIAERYMYLPNVGLMYFLASILYTNPVMSAVFITMYATKLWFYMDMYQNDYFLTEYANLHSPDAWFSWHVKAMKRWEMKSHQEAVYLWTTALQISPKEFKLNLNLATALKLGKFDAQAAQLIKTAAENIPSGQEAQTGELIKKWHEGNLAIVL